MNACRFFNPPAVDELPPIPDDGMVCDNPGVVEVPIPPMFHSDEDHYFLCESHARQVEEFALLVKLGIIPLPF